jgi:AcrR family transcriptional regulator
MVEDEKRRRAPAMSQEERRAAIVRTTLPLLIEHGGTVSTSQIAAAAGIAEGTVFRAFKDKQDLLIECMRAGLDSDAEIAHIEAIDRTLPLRKRLTEGVEAVGGYLVRLWTVGQALNTAGIGREDMHRHVHDKGGQPDAGPPAQVIRISQAFAGLFDQPGDELRVSSEKAVRMLLSLIFSNRMQGPGIGAAMDDPAEIVDLFLHGVIRTEEGNQP